MPTKVDPELFYNYQTHPNSYLYHEAALHVATLRALARGQRQRVYRVATNHGLAWCIEDSAVRFYAGPGRFGE